MILLIKLMEKWLMKFTKFIKPELEYIYDFANFTKEEEKIKYKK